ncbi:MAG: hypothetical protein OEU09_22360 [Rhodospirillales bacterium]|nr:hypothetical protein [Rhodospirillales bacterium]MDH3914032.1 hypothetical protein [Rhodospirillales bacterium]
MLSNDSRPHRSRNRTPGRRSMGLASWLATALLASVLTLGAFAQDAVSGDRDNDGKFCTATVEAALEACGNEVRDDFWIAQSNCINVSNPGDRNKCFKLAEEERAEGSELCEAQLGARLDLCGALGEARYDPKFDPKDFVDPLEIGNSVAPNPYFPLEQGRKWVYEGGDETITVTVTSATKLIGGVTCLVVNDTVEEDGVVTEDTDDWYAQDVTGNVWYCGEISLEFDLPDGEDISELVGVEGSWKAFRDFAKPDILMEATPRVGDVYRQEMALGDAEDAAEVLSVTASEAAPAASCDGDCLITLDFTPLEPDVFEYKYYAPGVGLILEVDPETSERLELVDMTP